MALSGTEPCKKFGVDLENPSCEHIHDPSRELYFFSDFPHSIKNLKNWIVKIREFDVRIFSFLQK